MTGEIQEISVTASLTPLPSVLQETEDKRKTVGDSRVLWSVLCTGSRWRTPALGLAFYRHCPGITISFVFECIVYEWNQVGEQNKWEHRRTSCVLESAVPALSIWIDSHNNRHSNRLSELLNTHAQCFGVKKKKGLKAIVDGRYLSTTQLFTQGSRNILEKGLDAFKSERWCLLCMTENCICGTLALHSPEQDLCNDNASWHRIMDGRNLTNLTSPRWRAIATDDCQETETSLLQG